MYIPTRTMTGAGSRQCNVVVADVVGRRGGEVNIVHLASTARIGDWCFGHVLDVRQMECRLRQTGFP